MAKSRNAQTICRALEAQTFVCGRRVSSLPPQASCVEILARLPFSPGLTTVELDTTRYAWPFPYEIVSPARAIESLIIPDAPQLRHLVLNSNCHDEVMVASLAKMTQLTSLMLCFEVSANDQFVQLPLLPQLRRLDLWNYGSNGVPLGLVELTTMCQLTHLWQFSFNENDMQAVSVALSASLRELRSLTLGCWVCDQWHASWQHLGDALPSLSHLTHLHMHNISLYKQGPDRRCFEPSNFGAFAPGLMQATSLIELKLLIFDSTMSEDWDDDDDLDTFDYSAADCRAVVGSIGALTRLQALDLAVPLNQYDCHLHFERLTALTRLYMHLPLATTDDNANALARMLSGMTLLTHLQLDTRGMGPVCKSSLFQTILPSLPRLSFTESARM